MIENIQPTPTKLDPTVASPDVKGAPTADTPVAKQPAQAADASSQGDVKPSTRLLIDQDKATGGFVYRIIDAVDGRLLTEIPRETLEQLSQADDYTAGALVSTTA